MNPTLQLIKNHRSIRKYKEKPIDDALLMTVLEAAQYGSTSSYLQAYTVIRVKNTETRSAIADLSGDQKYVVTAAEFLVFCADLHRLQKAKSGSDIGFTELMMIASIDSGIFAQNVLLGFESLGIGGVYIGGIRNDITQMVDLLDLPQGVFPLFGMCLGYPDQRPESKPRLLLTLVLKEDHYAEDKADVLLEYDQNVKAYYQTRTKGKINHTWTEQVSSKLAGELRPHMKKALERQGFCLK